MTFVTPASPSEPNPKTYGRPTSTALAPNASALSTSVPRRIPPSTKTGTRPATLSATCGSASMVAGTVSRLRPPWLETMIPATPALTARSASSGLSTPFSSSGILAKERSHSTSFQLKAASNTLLKISSEPVRTPPLSNPLKPFRLGNGGSLTLALVSRLRAPTIGVSTVRQSARYPPASARCTSSRVKPWSACG